MAINEFMLVMLSVKPKKPRCSDSRTITWKRKIGRVLALIVLNNGCLGGILFAKLGDTCSKSRNSGLKQRLCFAKPS